PSRLRARTGVRGRRSPHRGERWHRPLLAGAHISGPSVLGHDRVRARWGSTAPRTGPFHPQLRGTGRRSGVGDGAVGLATATPGRGGGPTSGGRRGGLLHARRGGPARTTGTGRHGGTCDVRGRSSYPEDSFR